MPSILAKDRTVAAPGFNRWLVPPAALAIHLSIGMAYGFSVFWLPLSRVLREPRGPANRRVAVHARACRRQPAGVGQEPLTIAAPAPASNWPLVATAWVLVSLPLSWGVYNTVALALQMVR